MSKLMERVITVEYAIRDDDDRRNGYSPDRRGGRDASPRRGYERRRSPSPYGRERGSPDYGYNRERESPDYGHASPKPVAQGSPGYARPESKGSPGFARSRSRSRSPANGRYDSRSPTPRERSQS